MKKIKNLLFDFLQKLSERYNPEKGRWRISSAAYTLIHKWAFLKREKYVIGNNTPAGFFHDWEKPVMYLMPGITNDQIQNMHLYLQPHHTSSPRQNKVEHLLELYIDWDSSAITKPDKPLNPYATLLYFHSHAMERVLPMLLAVNPDIVSPVVQDMDAARKANNPNYFFKQPQMNQKLFQQATGIIQRIDKALHQLPDTFNPDYLPEFLSEMTPEDIFLKAAFIMAVRRHQIVDTEAMRQKIKNIAEQFAAQTAFICDKNAVKTVMDNNRLMAHPFIKDKYAHGKQNF